MTLVLLGSRALAIRAPSLLNRPPMDFDFVGPLDNCEHWIERNADDIGPYRREQLAPGKFVLHTQSKNLKLEFDTTRDSRFAESNLKLLEIVVSSGSALGTKFGLIPTLDTLFAIKKSHRHLKDSPHFWKTLRDYHAMKAAGAKIEGPLVDWVKMREKETYWYKHPNLNQSKKDFFDPNMGVQYVYDHDSIHEAVKLFDKPAYRYFAKDGEEVKSDKTKFFNCPREIQLASVVEESAVLAIERSLVPHPGVLTVEQAWRKAFSKVLSSITSGWWRDFAYENALDALKMYPSGYFDKFKIGLENGTVKPFSGNTYSSAASGI